ncbi:MAG: insulinase family protein [Candidatus Parabeggiatoa sp. nov. 3]|nr:MAG: insulinase family protein [Gammaproteobacteria bacterium]RKZ60329.1 MAG: insulinase family protein [Gammaproteobacteria bacterium]RKZ81116.1 MAG: insulinase family protein [Gammaproteobacteria bacterium]HEW98148.1 insulinase family protein [Beggiatoa sp.]
MQITPPPFWLGLFFLSWLFCHNASSQPTIQHWQTDSGTRVYFVPAPDLPMVDIEIVFDAGSARDGKQSGLAMLTNDLLSEGAAGHSADEIAEHFDNLGAELSNSVDSDMASVSLRSLSEPALLQPAVNMLALLLAKPDFEATAFERLRQQTLIGLKYQEQQPSSLARKAFYQSAFGKHPYASLSDGTAKTVSALTRDDLKAFHGRYYVAKNALISIVGALERTAAETLAKTIIEQLSPGETPLALPPVIELEQALTQHIEHPSTQTHILIGQPGVARGDPDYFNLYVGNYILGGSGLVSRLSERIREQRGLAYSTYSYFSPRRVAGPFIASVKTRQDQATEAMTLLKQTLAEFIKQGPSAAELKKAKQGITGSFPLRIKSNSNIIGYLSMLGYYRLPLDYLHTFNQNVEGVTVDKIRKAFQQRIHPDKLVTITVGQVQ